MWKERCTTMCPCGDDIVQIYCSDLQCPNNKSYPLYCIACQLAFDKHQHKGELIFDKIAELDEAWTSQKEAFHRITTGSTQRYEDLGQLINYFEHEMLIVSFSALAGIAVNNSRTISQDVQTLDILHTDFRQVSAVAESLVVQRDLIKLIAMVENLSYFTAQLKSLEYLGTLTEADIFEKYYPAIISDNSSPFSNFTQNDRDTYIRLKFKAINKRNSTQHNA